MLDYTLHDVQQLSMLNDIDNINDHEKYSNSSIAAEVMAYTMLAYAYHLPASNGPITARYLFVAANHQLADTMRYIVTDRIINDGLLGNLGPRYVELTSGPTIEFRSIDEAKSHVADSAYTNVFVNLDFFAHVVYLRELFHHCYNESHYRSTPRQTFVGVPDNILDMYFENIHGGS